MAMIGCIVRVLGESGLANVDMNAKRQGTVGSKTACHVYIRGLNLAFVTLRWLDRQYRCDIAGYQESLADLRRSDYPP
jgi:hypothetical protein